MAVRLAAGDQAADVAVAGAVSATVVVVVVVATVPVSGVDAAVRGGTDPTVDEFVVEPSVVASTDGASSHVLPSGS